ncbi:MAG: hypothetical protein IPL83_02615 [Bdellovibrionales bacterium]|nr:hypothetical protein [Bdellovibrionales bacterium]MBK9038047.1 hypothetical protein [Bdellovibrionales bacterium]
MKNSRMNNFNPMCSLFFCLIFMVALNFIGFVALGQSGLEGQISDTINSLVRIINILIVGFVVWSGFLIAKGDGSGVARLIYGIIGLVVVNAAQLIISYFR